MKWRRVERKLRLEREGRVNEERSKAGYKEWFGRLEQRGLRWRKGERQLR